MRTDDGLKGLKTNIEKSCYNILIASFFTSTFLVFFVYLRVKSGLLGICPMWFQCCGPSKGSSWELLRAARKLLDEEHQITDKKI